MVFGEQVTPTEFRPFHHPRAIERTLLRSVAIPRCPWGGILEFPTVSLADGFQGNIASFLRANLNLHRLKPDGIAFSTCILLNLIRALCCDTVSPIFTRIKLWEAPRVPPRLHYRFAIVFIGGCVGQAENL